MDYFLFNFLGVQFHYTMSHTFTMEEFAASVNEFLAFRRYDILPDNGRISSKNAHAKAYAEYEIFNKTQKIESDFDKSVKKLLQ